MMYYKIAMIAYSKVLMFLLMFLFLFLLLFLFRKAFP